MTCWPKALARSCNRFMVVASNKPLSGLGVLMTRPRNRGEQLAASIASEGGRIYHYPVVEIVPPADTGEIDAQLSNLDRFELLVFVSVPAVENVATRLQVISKAIPETVKVAAVGAATAKCCVSRGIPVDFVPDRQMDSEGLFQELSGFPLEGRQVLICRGQTGREQLRHDLQKCGARVEYLSCYMTRLTQSPIEPVVREWRQGNIDIVLVTSVSIVEGLVSLLGPGNLELFNTSRVVTISDRIASRCRVLGAGQVEVAAGADDQAILAQLHRVSHRQGSNDN